MRTNNAMQLKALIRNRAKAEGVSPQLIMQNYVLERLIERISLSSWRDCIVIKGGVLISSLIGVDKRSTKDLDTTIQGFALTQGSAEKAFREITAVDANDDFEFKFLRAENIREGDEYPGIRVHLAVNYEMMSFSVTVDITTGDKITPEAIKYSYPLLFDNRSILLMAYPLATVLAEKLETVISRNIANTRLRDYYDIYTLWKTRKHTIDLNLLQAALVATTKKRRSHSAMSNYSKVMKQVTEDPTMLSYWSAYARRYPYVGDLSLRDACDVVIEIMEKISW